MGLRSFEVSKLLSVLGYNLAGTFNNNDVQVCVVAAIGGWLFRSRLLASEAMLWWIRSEDVAWCESHFDTLHQIHQIPLH
jgi:hypothetical protein